MGITDSREDMEERKNVRQEWPIYEKGKAFKELFFEAFDDEMLRIICAAAVIQVILDVATEGLVKGWIEGFSVLMEVTFLALSLAGSSYFREKPFEKPSALNKMK